MKFVHLSDLHLGKRVNEFSMLEDQQYILLRVLQIIEGEKPDAVVIAGDVYDKAIPPAEAVTVFDEFLVKLAAMKLQVFVISGNHDSAERIAFGGRLMDASGIHMAPVYHGEVSPFILTDRYGEVRIYMLPFIKPADVRRVYPGEESGSYTEAVRTAVSHLNVDLSVRNILIAHQFVTGAARSESEDVSVGGMDNVDVSVFEAFDYAALGHIHGPQHIGRETIRYCGTPLKYSFSEKDHLKSVTVVTMEEKGKTAVRTVPLKPLHDMREIRGTYNDLTLKKNYAGTDVEDYLHIILTDEDDVPDAMARLRTVYPNIMKLDYDNSRTRYSGRAEISEEMEQKSEIELFEEFFEKQNGRAMSEEQRLFSEQLMDRIREKME